MIQVVVNAPFVKIRFVTNLNAKQIIAKDSLAVLGDLQVDFFKILERDAYEEQNEEMLEHETRNIPRYHFTLARDEMFPRR